MKKFIQPDFCFKTSGQEEETEPLAMEAWKEAELSTLTVLSQDSTSSFEASSSLLQPVHARQPPV